MYLFLMCKHDLLKTLNIRKTRISVQEIKLYQYIQQHPFFPQRLSLVFKHDYSLPPFRPINNDLCSSEKRQVFYPERSNILLNLVRRMLFSLSRKYNFKKFLPHRTQPWWASYVTELDLLPSLISWGGL